MNQRTRLQHLERRKRKNSGWQVFYLWEGQYYSGPPDEGGELLPDRQVIDDLIDSGHLVITVEYISIPYAVSE
jgi:hypothetical protein